jgi:hypothetical protein
MGRKPRWSDLERDRRAVPSFLAELQSNESSASQPGSAWGTWHVLESTRRLSRADAAALATRVSDAASTADTQSPFVFSIDDVTLRSGVAIMECTPTTRRLPPPVRDLDLVRLLMHGSLRLGGPVSFASGKYLGYAVCAVCYALTAAAVDAAVEWLSPRSLGVDSLHELKGLLRLEWTVAFPIGLFSDAFAPRGYHRKSCMILGWSVLAAVWAAQLVATQSFSSGALPPAFASALAIVAMLALAMVHISLTVRVLELSQQEELSTRGGVVAMYLVFTLLPQLVVRAVVLLQSALHSPPSDQEHGRGLEASASASGSAGDGQLDLAVPLPLAYAVLMVVALVPVPCLIAFAHETPCAVSSSRSCLASLRWHTVSKRIGDAFHRLWSAANSKAVSDVVIVNAVLSFFARMEYPGADRAVSEWCGETRTDMLVQAVVLSAATIASVAVWRTQLAHMSWVSGVMATILVWKLSAVACTVLVAFGALREPWVPTIAALGVAPANVTLWLAGILPTVEVVQAGNEGAIYGLVVSYQLLLQLVGDQVVSGIQSTGALVSPDRPSQDASRVVIGAVALTAISLLSLLAVWFLPRQKLEAQQRRLLGGFSESRRLALAGGLVVLYALVAVLQLVHSAHADHHNSI